MNLLEDCLRLLFIRSDLLLIVLNLSLKAFLLNFCVQLQLHLALGFLQLTCQIQDLSIQFDVSGLQGLVLLGLVLELLLQHINSLGIGLDDLLVVGHGADD